MSIIGIVFGKKNKPWARISENGEAIEVFSFDDHPVYAGIVDQTIDGQAMVSIPQFHYRAGTVETGQFAGKKAVWVSSAPAVGFSIHPAFMKAGEVIDQFWVGKYQGTDDAGKLGSQPGLPPKTRITIAQAREAAEARNKGEVSGFMLWGVHQLDAIKMLALIELGTPDARGVLGNGNVDGNGVLHVDHELVAQATWRGIVGLWGNVWQMFDGLQTDDRGCYRIWDSNGDRNYVDTGCYAPDGYIHSRHTTSGDGFDLGANFLPKKTRDEQKRAKFKSWTCSWSNGVVAYHGGHWSNGDSAGLFSLYVSYAASYADANLGGRLAKV